MSCQLIDKTHHHIPFNFRILKNSSFNNRKTSQHLKSISPPKISSTNHINLRQDSHIALHTQSRMKEIILTRRCHCHTALGIIAVTVAPPPPPLMTVFPNTSVNDGLGDAERDLETLGEDTDSLCDGLLQNPAP